MRQTAQKLVAAIVVHERFDDYTPERRHSRGEPLRNVAAV
jgi:hypothetical protein